jgi:hypothetical protein
LTARRITDYLLLSAPFSTAVNVAITINNAPNPNTQSGFHGCRLQASLQSENVILSMLLGAGVAEPASDRSHDFVDFEWAQEVWFFFQLHTPFQKDLIRPPLLLIAFINNLLDGGFPFSKTHRLFLLDCGIVSCEFNCDVGMIESDCTARMFFWHKPTFDAG